MSQHQHQSRHQPWTPWGYIPWRVEWHLFWNRYNPLRHHLARETRNLTVSLRDPTVRGWLFECSCGKTWAY